MMTALALIYHRPSKWPIATAFGAALLIHLSAVAIAFHREPSMTEPPLSDSMNFLVDITDDSLPPPPDPDIPIPPAPAPPTTDFIEPRETPHAISKAYAPIRRSPQTRIAPAANGKTFAISAPRPDYPYEARSRHLTGTGVAVINVDSASGMAIDAVMEQSIGNPILDNSAISAFRRWRFKPGTPARIRIPITFMLTGAQY